MVNLLDLTPPRNGTGKKPVGRAKAAVGARGGNELPFDADLHAEQNANSTAQAHGPGAKQSDPELSASETDQVTAVPQQLKQPAKFVDPDWTLGGDARAMVPLKKLDTLWFNTGTLCNIACVNCYIESSPKNDRLVFITCDDVKPFLIEAKARGTLEIAYTGGEPFLNPDMINILRLTLDMGFEALVLTNAMGPMQRKKVAAKLLQLRDDFSDQLTLRISLDHHTQKYHEQERGPRSWHNALKGMDWLAANGFQMAIAGRSRWGEDDLTSRAGYRQLIEDHGWPIDPENHSQVTLLPEMDEGAEVPEISTKCWKILNKKPADMMCSTSRMVVKRHGAERATVLPCTLIPYDDRFDMGPSLTAAEASNEGMFRKGAIKLCHVHCAKFCVLGGGSCS